MKQTILDTTTHELTSMQVLEMCMRIWNVNRSTRIIMLTRAGDQMDMLRRIRVSLSSLRKSAAEANTYVQNFGIEGEVLPVSYRVSGMTKGAIMINYRMTKLQAMKNVHLTNQVPL